jgi:hypothetical protein
MTDHWNVHIERILDIVPEGEGNPQLNAALQNFSQAWNDAPPSEAALDAAVVDLAGVLNRDVDDMRLSFESFRQKATEESHNEALANFVGSREALLFGTVIGEVLGLDPVFAALLSPTGGMVGPGGASFHVNGGVLGYHGVAHDAGGYLCRRHGIDPGYEYIEDRSGLPCETSPLSGQVSGIAFWFKLLKLGWLNFLAESDPGSLLTPSLESRAAASDDLPSSAQSSDGVILDRAELLFLKALINREFDPMDEALIAEGLRSLQERGYISGGEEEGYTINDQLVLATAVYFEPQQRVEASTGALEDAAGGETLSYYQWGDIVVEKTNPAPGQIRLAGLQDAGHAAERLGQVIPLTESDLDALSMSMTEEEFETAVAHAQAGTIDPGDAIPLESLGGPSPESANDLAGGLGTGRLAGSIRVQQFDGRNPGAARDMKFFQGAQGTWLVSRDSQNAGRVDVSLATPQALAVISEQ